MSAAVSSVCLAMIVKDEAAVIERCLASVRPFIDAWVVCDTGSSDATRELVAATLAGLPGELVERPWQGFAANRSEALALARDRATHTLVIDADHTVEGDPERLRRLDADAYHVKLSTPDASSQWSLPCLVRSALGWRYEGVVHEYITTDSAWSSAPLEGVTIIDHADGGTGRERRWESDAALLEAELERNPDDARSVFYLGQTYRGLGRLEDALRLYERRAGMPGWEEETYCALHQVGLLAAQLGQWPRALDAYLRAYDVRPSRVEALYDLLGGLRERGQHRLAYLLSLDALDAPVPPDLLFVEPWRYRWGVRFEHSIAAYWVGENDRALAACDTLLARPDLPPNFREATIRNRDFCLARRG